MLVASSQGGIQALSRSYFGKIIPKKNAGEFFGFYNIFGKFAAIMGPFLVGIISQATGSSRYGVLSISVLFIIGLALMLRVRRFNNSNSGNDSDAGSTTGTAPDSPQEITIEPPSGSEKS